MTPDLCFLTMFYNENAVKYAKTTTQVMDRHLKEENFKKNVASILPAWFSVSFRFLMLSS